MSLDREAAAMAEAAQDPAAFEAGLVDALRVKMVGVRPIFESRARDHVWIDEVRIVDTYPDSVLEVFLRDDRRPGCRFVSMQEVWRPWTFVGGADIDTVAFYIGVFLREEIDAVRYGLSEECEPGVTTPIGSRAVSLEEASELADFWVRVPEAVPPSAELSVFYEPNREFGRHQSVTLRYRWLEGELLIEQSANFRGALPQEGWEMREHDGWPMTIWHLEEPAPLVVGIRWEDAEVHLSSSTLDEASLLTLARSLRVPGALESSPG